MQDQLAAKSTELESTQEEKVSLQDQLAAKSTELESTQEEKVSLQDQLAAKSTELESTQEEKVSLQDQLAAKSTELESTQEEKVSLQDQLAVKISNSNEHIKKIGLLEKKILFTLSKIERMKRAKLAKLIFPSSLNNLLSIVGDLKKEVSLLLTNCTKSNINVSSPTCPVVKRPRIDKDPRTESARFVRLKKEGHYVDKAALFKPAEFNGRVAISTVLDLSFFEGCEVLLYSIKQNNPGLDFDFIVFTDGGIPDYILKSLKTIHPKVFFKIVKSERYKIITPHPRIGITSYFIFEVFSLTEYDRVICLDSDLLCLKGLSGLMQATSDFAASLNVGNTLYAERLLGSKRPVFNSGVISIGKKYLSESVTSELIQLAAKEVGKDDPSIARFADQRVLNYFFKDKEIDFLPINFNGLTKLSKLVSERDMKLIALLHYTGTKPWEYLHRKNDYPNISEQEDKYMRKWGRIQKEIRKDLRTQQYASSGELDKLKVLKSKRQSDRCFILGNGPSLKTQDLKLLKDEFTFVSNWFGLHPNYEEINPSLYTVASHTVFGGWRSDKVELNKEFKEMLLGPPRDTPKVFSFNFKEYIEKEGFFSGQELYYLIYEKPLKRRIDQVGEFNFNPSLPVVEADTVVLTFSLMLAVYMGYKKIYLLGCDCDYIGANPSDSDSRYFYDISKHSTKTSSDAHISKVWGNDGRIFQAYELAFSACQKAGVNLYNATNGGKLEVLPRVHYNDLF